MHICSKVDKELEAGLSIDEIIGDKKKYIDAFDELTQNAHTLIESTINKNQDYWSQFDNLKEVVTTTTGTLAITTALIASIIKNKKSNK